MKLKNLSTETQSVLDQGDGVGRHVPPGELGDFTELCANDLLTSLPAIWAPAPQTLEESDNDR